MYLDKTPFQYLYGIKEDLLTKNRFFVNEDFNKLLDIIIQQEQEQLTKSTKLYRARLYLEDDVYDRFDKKKIIEGPFKGYNSEDSFVNLKNGKQGGRANPAGISYLYTSTDKETSVLEVCNKRMVAVSVADILINEQLKILNLSKTGYVTSSTLSDLNKTRWINDLKMELSNEMNRPFFDEREYVLTQYICEYVKKNSLDGIKYSSACHTGNDKNMGKNIVIFSYDKCEAVSSDLYLVNNISLDLQCFNK